MSHITEGGFVDVACPYCGCSLVNPDTYAEDEDSEPHMYQGHAYCEVCDFDVTGPWADSWDEAVELAVDRFVEIADALSKAREDA